MINTNHENFLTTTEEKVNTIISSSNYTIKDNPTLNDLRKCKNRQKMAGGFRTDAGQQMYCDVLSVVETCKRKGGKIFEKIMEIFSRPVTA